MRWKESMGRLQRVSVAGLMVAEVRLCEIFALFRVSLLWGRGHQGFLRLSLPLLDWAGMDGKRGSRSAFAAHQILVVLEVYLVIRLYSRGGH